MRRGLRNWCGVILFKQWQAAHAKIGVKRAGSLSHVSGDRPVHDNAKTFLRQPTANLLPPNFDRRRQRDWTRLFNTHTSLNTAIMPSTRLTYVRAPHPPTTRSSRPRWPARICNMEGGWLTRRYTAEETAIQHRFEQSPHHPHSRRRAQIPQCQEEGQRTEVR